MKAGTDPEASTAWLTSTKTCRDSIEGSTYLGITESTDTAGDDTDFEKWVRVLQEPATNGVSSLVVRDGVLLVGAQESALALQTHDDPLNGGFEVILGDVVVADTRKAHSR